VTCSDILINDEHKSKLKEGESIDKIILEKSKNFKILSKNIDCTKIKKESFIEKTFQIDNSDKIPNSATSFSNNKDEYDKLESITKNLDSSQQV
jgi:hypothetical protein